MNMLDLTGLTQQPRAGHKTTAAAAAPTEQEAAAFSQAVAGAPGDQVDSPPGDAGDNGFLPKRALGAIAAALEDTAVATGGEGSPGAGDGAAAAGSLLAVPTAGPAAAGTAPPDAAGSAIVAMPQTLRPGAGTVGPDMRSPASQANATLGQMTGPRGADAPALLVVSAGPAPATGSMSSPDTASANAEAGLAGQSARAATAASVPQGIASAATAAAPQAGQTPPRGAANRAPSGPDRPPPGIAEALDNAADNARPKIEATPAASRPMSEAAPPADAGDAPEGEPAVARLAAAGPQADAPASRPAAAAHAPGLAASEAPSAATAQGPQHSHPANAGSSPASPVMPAERAVLHQIAAAIVPGTVPGKIDLTLDPPELGRIEIIIELSDQTLKATLSAERHGTGDLIRRHLDQLVNQFREAGFADVDLTFAENGRNGRGDFERDAPEMAVPEAAVAEGPVQGVVAPTVTTSRIDIRL